jgi:hypothetical protein
MKIGVQGASKMGKIAGLLMKPGIVVRSRSACPPMDRPRSIS